MSMPESTTILIVGAGPAGLATALSLIHHNFRDFVIVDAVDKGENTSRALVVHAATMEALDSIGCGEEVDMLGRKCEEVIFGTRDSILVHADLAGLKGVTRYPYGVIMPQHMTESVLGKKLASFGITVHRPCKVVNLRRNAKDNLYTDVWFDNGKTIRAKYVIGADGARSAVRTCAGIGFTDPKSGIGDDVPNLRNFVLADVSFDGGDPEQFGFRGTMSPDSFFLCVACPRSFNDFIAAESGKKVEETIYRIGSGVPIADGEPPHAPNREYLQVLVNRHGPSFMSSDKTVNPNPMRIKDTFWSTRFRTHSAIADKAFIRLGNPNDIEIHENLAVPKEGGVIVLVGDAAHIHSPAGGQGMNLGLRDGVFLGEALVKHAKAFETQPPTVDTDVILRRFAEARHIRALEVIGFTKKLLFIAGMHYDDKAFWWLPFGSAFLRDWVLWGAFKFGLVRQMMAWELSGLGRR
ncbi:hypothetical protein HYDPIDRAFT_164954 [Hydnomerulius pinastri MD-312]|nr:hypothetical protein HYDPIDRAFT_164954 [Hydnomerulius pinastri MD-312]